jgi:hypothetical protein
MDPFLMECHGTRTAQYYVGGYVGILGVDVVMGAGIIY